MSIEDGLEKVAARVGVGGGRHRTASEKTKMTRLYFLIKLVSFFWVVTRSSYSEVARILDHRPCLHT
jgi:hypothetical protein